MTESFAIGSHGSVHRGFWSGIPVVVKRILVENRKQFRKEAGIWYNLRHRHIVQLFGACDVGSSFFVSELASNGTLTNYLYFNSDKTWRKMYEVSLGLSYLHTQQRVVHGDLKCNNILVAADGSAKIADFDATFEISGPPVTIDPDAMGAIQWKAPKLLTG